MRDLCIIHIPKTAGKTLSRGLLGHAINSKTVNRVYVGHHEYGFFQELVNPIMIVTLRNPIKRWISNLNWTVFREMDDTPNHMVQIWKSFPRSQFIQQCCELGVNVNVMVKMIAGVPSIDTYQPHRCKTRKFTKKEMDHMLDIAKQNILNFEHVGFMNNLKVFYKSICETYGFPVGKPRRYHRHYRSPVKCPFSEDEIYKLNKYDVELYEFAKNARE